MKALMAGVLVCLPLLGADWKLVWSDEFNGERATRRLEVDVRGRLHRERGSAVLHERPHREYPADGRGARIEARREN